MLPYFKKAQVSCSIVSCDLFHKYHKSVFCIYNLQSTFYNLQPYPVSTIQTNSAGGDDYRGSSGPLHVTHYAGEGPLDRAWLEAGQQAGGRQGKISAAHRKYLLIARLPADRGHERVPAGGRGQDGLHRAPRHALERRLGLPAASPRSPGKLGL